MSSKQAATTGQANELVAIWFAFASRKLRSNSGCSQFSGIIIVMNVLMGKMDIRGEDCAEVNFKDGKISRHVKLKGADII